MNFDILLRAHFQIQVLAIFGVLCLSTWAQPAPAQSASAQPLPAVVDAIALGRYLTVTSSCNTCHSPDYLARSGQSDERKTWLTGNPVGWYSPKMGTIYAPNLRLLAASVDEATFLARARSNTLRGPMPWFELRQMKDADLRAIYLYTRSLSPAGVLAPSYVPPGPPPATPYFQFPQVDVTRSGEKE